MDKNKNVRIEGGNTELNSPEAKLKHILNEYKIMAAEKAVFFKVQPVLEKIEALHIAKQQAELSKRISQWNGFVKQYPFLQNMISDKLKQILLGGAVVAKAQANQQDNPQWDELVKKIDDAIKEVETSLAPIFKNIVLLKGEDNYPQLLQELRDKIGYTQPEKDEQNAIFAICVQLETEAKAAKDEKYIKIAEGKFNTLRRLDRQISDKLKFLDPALPINAKDKKSTKEAVSKTLETTYSRKDAVQAELAKFEKMSETERAQHQTEIANLQKTNDLLQDFLQMKQDFCSTDFTITSKVLMPDRTDVEAAYAEWLVFHGKTKEGFMGREINKKTNFSELSESRQEALGNEAEGDYNKVREYVIKKNYGGRFGIDESTQKLSIKIDANATKIEKEAATIHEMQHLIQAKKGKLGFYSNNVPAVELYDIWDEVEAYQMQFAAVPESFVKYKTKIQNISEITPEWVKAHNPFYAALPSIELSCSTLMSEVLVATYSTLSDKAKKMYLDEKLVDSKGQLNPAHEGKMFESFCKLLKIITF